MLKCLENYILNLDCVKREIDRRVGELKAIQLAKDFRHEDEVRYLTIENNELLEKVKYYEKNNSDT